MNAFSQIPPYSFYAYSGDDTTEKRDDAITALWKAYFSKNLTEPCQLQVTETKLSRWKCIQIRLQELFTREPLSPPLPSLKSLRVKTLLIATLVNLVAVFLMTATSTLYSLIGFLLTFSTICLLLFDNPSLTYHTFQLSKIEGKLPIVCTANNIDDDGNYIDPISLESILSTSLSIKVGNYLLLTDSILPLIFMRPIDLGENPVPHPIESRALKDEEMGLLNTLAAQLGILPIDLFSCFCLYEEEYDEYLDQILEKECPSLKGYRTRSNLDQYPSILEEAIREYIKPYLANAFRFSRLESLITQRAVLDQFSCIKDWQALPAEVQLCLSRFETYLKAAIGLQELDSNLFALS